MKFTKIALIGSAALAAASVSARADDISDLKAQIEALNGRIAQIETAPSVPAGYQLLSVSKQAAIVVPTLSNGDALPTATTVGIMPTADMPATTNIQWSGYVRAGLKYTKADTSSAYDDESDIDVLTRVSLAVAATTDTAVGEVGVKANIRGNNDGENDGFDGNTEEVELGTTFAPYWDSYWGWWKITPELALGGGYAGSLSEIGFGPDANMTNEYAVEANGTGVGTTTQMRLSYASGPIGFAIALEDGSEDDATDPDYWTGDALGFAGQVTYSGDVFAAELAAGWNDGQDNDEDEWTIGAGAGFGLGDMARIELVGEVGSSYGIDDDYTMVGALLHVSLTDAVFAEAGVNYKNPETDNDSTLKYSGSINYAPVSQLKIGLEAAVTDSEEADSDVFEAALVTVYKF